MKIEIEGLEEGYLIKVETDTSSAMGTDAAGTEAALKKRIAVTDNKDLIEKLKKLVGYTDAFNLVPAKKTRKPRGTYKKRKPKTETETQEELHDVSRSSRTSNLFIDSFEYDPKQTKKYKTISYFEHEDGRIMLSYLGSHYYTTKQKLETLPEPLPRGYLSNLGLSTNAQTAIRFYLQQKGLKKIADTVDLIHKAKERKETPLAETGPALA